MLWRARVWICSQLTNYVIATLFWQQFVPHGYSQIVSVAVPF
jgi:hypothetical protein